MNLFQALIYGLVQGLTEFLPVSSSAHLRLVPELFGWPDAGAAFTAVIQLGTIAAVVLYFRRDLVAAAKGWARSLSTRDLSPIEARIGWGVLVGTIPIVVLALLFKHQIEGPFRSLWVVAAAFIGMGIVMLLAERYGNKARTEGSVTIKDGAIVGIWQALALIPGMSRSGSTISGALLANFDRPTAARFSFLLSIPSITAAGLYEAFKERKGLGGELLAPTVVATIVSFVVGYAAISWLIPFVARRGIRPFVGYRIGLGLLLIVLLLTGHLAPTRARRSPPPLAFRKRAEAVTPLWLIVGLGNPGPEYARTRHNVGWDVIDRLSERHRIRLDRAEQKARYGVGRIEDVPVALVKPLTFMNVSGEAVKPLLGKWSLDPHHLLVIADDLDLPWANCGCASSGATAATTGIGRSSRRSGATSTRV